MDKYSRLDSLRAGIILHLGGIRRYLSEVELESIFNEMYKIYDSLNEKPYGLSREQIDILRWLASNTKLGLCENVVFTKSGVSIRLRERIWLPLGCKWMIRDRVFRHSKLFGK